MEITNCEQYVLAELDYEQRRNERLAAENNKLFKQLDAMTKRANGYSRIINRPKTPIEALADKVMREEMLTRFTYAEVTDVKSAFSGRLLDFDEWCVSVNIIFTISTNAFSPIAPTRIRRIRQRGCAAFGA